MNTRNKRAVQHRPETLAKREEILKVAALMFGEKGTSNTTLQDIAGQVGMTHAGVLHYFGSKKGLLLEVLKYRDNQDVADLEGKRMPGGLDAFRHLIKTAEENMKRSGIVQTYLILSSESVTEGNLGKDYFFSRYSCLRAELSEALGKVLVGEQGSLSDSDRTAIEDAVAGILAAMDGLQLQWLLDPEHVNLARASRFIIETAVSAVIDPHENCLDRNR
ncbi:MAG: TetR/AcrR family transcriptional regulator [Bifidobacterium sp.]|uniref:TetR/AcrR family transcriptional regulator n=1 Tax=Bifidobacterium fermentum TaxID=3059035 RepID=A0AB39UNI5_9BIFI